LKKTTPSFIKKSERFEKASTKTAQESILVLRMIRGGSGLSATFYGRAEQPRKLQSLLNDEAKWKESSSRKVEEAGSRHKKNYEGSPKALYL